MKKFIMIVCLLYLGLSPIYAQKEIESLDIQEFRDANAVIRKHSKEIEIASTTSMTVKEYKLITVLNSKGNNTTFSYASYDNDWELKNVEALIYDASGQLVKKFKKRDFIDESAVDGSTLYSDSRVKYVDYKPSHYPYSIAFTKEYSTNSTAFIPSHHFIPNYHTFVQNSEYEISYDSSQIKLILKEKNFDQFSIEKTEIENEIRYTAKNIASIPKEDLHVPNEYYMPRIMAVAEDFNLSGYEANGIDNWKKLGQWFQDELLSKRNQLSQSTINEVRKMTEGVKDTLEKAKIIYNYVQNNTRYISVQVGVGGYQPIEAHEVDEMKYGDCKGLSNYTKALLQSVGVNSYYTHVEAGHSKINFESDFASLEQGNHVILSIPYKNKLHWIDCTSQTAPFGFLGDFTDDRQVLVMTPNGGEIVKTPNYINKENTQTTNASLSFNAQGEVDIQGKILSRGIQYHNRQYIENLSPRDLQKRDSQFWSSIDNLEVIKHEMVNNKDEIFFEEVFHLKGDHLLSNVSDRIFIPINLINANTYIPERYRTRKTPFYISRGYYDEDTIEIVIPEGYKLESTPEDFNLETEFGSYSMTIKKNEEFLTYQKKIIVNEGIYPKEKYNDYREFRKDISKIELKKITLIQKP